MTNIIEKKYDEFVDYNFIIDDIEQRRVIKKIYTVWKKTKKLNFFFNFNSNKNNKSGIYLHGGVGIGKTFILNIFIRCFKKTKKYHYNSFMSNLHNYINNSKEKNIIENYIKNLSKNYKIIFIDELHIFNIVDALLIKKIFLLFKKYKIFILVSSNFLPKNLYKDGLQRNDFIPFIEFLNNNLEIIYFEHNKDYRRQMLNQSKTYFTPINSITISEFNKLFNKLVDIDSIHKKTIHVKSREIVFEKCTSNIVYCSFEELCCNNLGYNDYKKIGEEFNLVFIENVPQFHSLNVNECRRFISLIDTLYDQNRSVVILAAFPIKKLCTIEKLSKEFDRISSRLYEMTLIKPV